MPSGASAGASFISAMQGTSVALLSWACAACNAAGVNEPARRASGPVVLVFADQQPAVGQVHVRRHLEVVGRRLVLEHAARQIEGRAMARTQEAAGPIIGQR